MIHINAKPLERLEQRVQKLQARLAPGRFSESTLKRARPRVERAAQAAAREGTQKAARTPNQKKASENISSGIRVKVEGQMLTIETPEFEGATDYAKVAALNLKQIKENLYFDILDWVKHRKEWTAEQDQTKTGYLSPRSGTNRRLIKRPKWHTDDQVTQRVMVSMSKDPKHWLESNNESGLVKFLQKKNPQGLALVTKTAGPGMSAAKTTEMSAIAAAEAELAVVEELAEAQLQATVDLLDELLG